MKRQLNFWSKMHGLPDKELINTSLSVEGNKFTVKFVRPGTVKPIDQIEIDLSNEEALQLKHAFELAGANVFQDETDEIIYFANIANARDRAEALEQFAVCVGWAVIFFIACMMIGMLLIKLPFLLVLFGSLIVSVLVGFLTRKFYYNATEAPNSSKSS